MAKPGLTITAAALAALVLLAVTWHLTCPSCQAKLKVQLQAAAGSGDQPPVRIVAGSGPAALNTGTVPAAWKPHVPASARKGPHKMYHHPARCRPNLSAPQELAYDWRFSPPAEGDL